MKIGEFIKILAAIDDISEAVISVREEFAEQYRPTEEGVALHNDIMPLLNDLIGKVLYHGEKYMRVGD